MGKKDKVFKIYEGGLEDNLTKIYRLENDWYFISSRTGRIPNEVFKIFGDKIVVFSDFNYSITIFKAGIEEYFKEDISEKIIFDDILHNYSESYPPYRNVYDIELRVNLEDYLTDEQIDDVIFIINKMEETDYFYHLRVFGD